MLSEPEADTDRRGSLLLLHGRAVVLPAYVRSYSLPRHAMVHFAEATALPMELAQAARGLGHGARFTIPTELFVEFRRGGRS